MAKPEHFKKIKWPTSCEDCQHAKRDWKKRVTNCTKHDFQILDTMNSQSLAVWTCNDALKYQEET